MAVLFTSANRNTQVTEDRAELLAAIDTLRGRQSVRRPNQARDDQTMYASGEDSLARLNQIGQAQQVSVQQFSDNMTQYKTLQNAARILGADDARRKAFVLVSEGIGKDLTGVFDRALTPCEAQCPTCPCYHDRAIGEMMESLRRSSVTHLCDRSARPRVTSGPRDRGVSGPAGTRRGSSHWWLPVEQPHSPGTGRADDHGRGDGRLRRHRYRRRHVRTASSHRGSRSLLPSRLLSERSGPDDGVYRAGSREPPARAATIGRWP